MCKYCELEGRQTCSELPHHPECVDDNCTMLLFPDGLVDLWVSDGIGYSYTEEFQFNFCPMCGRELDG